MYMHWGIAKAGVEPADGLVVGTMGFMSPEQARGDPDVDARSDIHALGAILRFLVNAPGDAPASERELPPRRMRALAAIVDRALAPTPEARYQSVLDLAADLSRYRDAQPVHAYRENMLERFVRVAGRYRLPLALILAYMLMRLLLLLAPRF